MSIKVLRWRCAAEGVVAAAVLVPAVAAAQGTVDMDRAALVALYNATGGAEWTDSANWLSDEPLEEWFGVSTGTAGRVTAVALPGNDLVGQIPPAIGTLAFLEELDLGSAGWDEETFEFLENRLSGPLPSSLWDLGKLTILDLDGNRLDGPLPAGAVRLTRLERLDLGANGFAGAIPAALGNLSALRVLWLNGNRLSGVIPVELARLANLEMLGLGNNRLSGPIPPYLGSMASAAPRVKLRTVGELVSSRESSHAAEKVHRSTHR